MPGLSVVEYLWRTLVADASAITSEGRLRLNDLQPAGNGMPGQYARTHPAAQASLASGWMDRPEAGHQGARGAAD
jgi:hypothetical protein